MARRPSARKIRAAQTYTIEEAAVALGVSTGTIRAWVRVGLPLMRERRPFLILGDALRQYLAERATIGRVTLQPGQLYCLTCKAARLPMGRLVDCIPQTAKTARLVGLCDQCGGTCNLMISRAKIGQFAGIFDLVLRDEQTD